ncbi:MAG: hypothetical protein K0R90_1148 [Oscillospiraceae bacterium]|jgi:uncharacterized protein (TIGR03905 family)|nr:hypothetical protein [Oscillospiraceae bacterium]
MEYRFEPTGVCARSILIELDGDIIKNVVFEGGCSGNAQGVSALVIGQKVNDVIEKLEGIKCGYKDSSCPAELSIALLEAIQII